MISRNQQQAIYCMIADIARETGHTSPEVEKHLKTEYWSDREGKMSLALDNCTKEHAQYFYEYVFDIAIQMGVVFNMKDDEGKVIHPLHWDFEQSQLVKTCIKHRVCAVTLRPGADIHHVDNIGRGFDRETVDHTQYRLMPLIREKHNECHNMGDMAFIQKYGIEGVHLTEEEVKEFNI